MAFLMAVRGEPGLLHGRRACRPREPFDYLARAESAEPLDALTRLFRGWYLYRLGRLEEAMAELSRAVELDPGNPEPRTYLAEIARTK
jgi:Flp pilus assembly protein TadD